MDVLDGPVTAAEAASLQHWAALMIVWGWGSLVGAEMRPYRVSDLKGDSFVEGWMVLGGTLGEGGMKRTVEKLEVLLCRLVGDEKLALNH